jgi:hypothetical protein
MVDGAAQLEVMRMKRVGDRPESLDGVNLQYAPTSELGVVYLFAELAKRWRVRVAEIGASYPDCVAYQRVRGREQRIRIEFEFRSKNFARHGHDPRDCDWIVCWEHDWPEVPRGLQVVELRREFGLGFNVWILPLAPKWELQLTKMKRGEWSVPSQAHRNDLVLMYITRPVMAIKYIYRLTERAEKRQAGWKPGKDYRALLAPVAQLSSPVFLEDLRTDPVLQTAFFVRGQMQGKPNAMDYWPYLYRLIVSRNKTLSRKLGQYAPERV